MLQEEYVTFEQAKLLKEKRFPAEIIHIGGLEDFPCMYIAPPKDYKGLWANDTGMKLPTLSLVQKWLREEKFISIEPSVGGSNQEKFTSWCCNMWINDNWYEEPPKYSTYEEALSVGIDKALELI